MDYADKSFLRKPSYFLKNAMAFLAVVFTMWFFLDAIISSI